MLLWHLLDADWRASGLSIAIKEQTSAATRNGQSRGGRDPATAARLPQDRADGLPDPRTTAPPA